MIASLFAMHDGRLGSRAVIQSCPQLAISGPWNAASPGEDSPPGCTSATAP